jgi:hypothetical protein
MNLTLHSLLMVWLGLFLVAILTFGMYAFGRYMYTAGYRSGVEDTLKKKSLSKLD